MGKMDIEKLCLGKGRKERRILRGGEYRSLEGTKGKGESVRVGKKKITGGRTRARL